MNDSVRKKEIILGTILLILSIALAGLFFLPSFRLDIYDEVGISVNGWDMFIGLYNKTEGALKMHPAAILILVIPVVMALMQFITLFGSVKKSKKAVIISILSALEIAGWIIVRFRLFYVDESKWSGWKELVVKVAAGYADKQVQATGYFVILAAAVITLIISIIYTTMVIIDEKTE